MKQVIEAAITELVKLSKQGKDSHEAMRFSQAALNLAHVQANFPSDLETEEKHYPLYNLDPHNLLGDKEFRELARKTVNDLYRKSVDFASEIGRMKYERVNAAFGSDNVSQ